MSSALDRIIKAHAEHAAAAAAPLSTPIAYKGSIAGGSASGGGVVANAANAVNVSTAPALTTSMSAAATTNPSVNVDVIRELLGTHTDSRTSEDVERVAEQAKNLTFFATLPSLIVLELCRHATYVSFAAGEEAYAEDRPADRLFVVVSGHVIQRRGADAAGKRVSGRLGQGTALAPHAVESGANHTETALAGAVGVGVMCVSREHFNKTLSFFADSSGASEGGADSNGHVLATTLGRLPLWDTVAARAILRMPPASRSSGDVERLAGYLRVLCPTLGRAADASLEVVSRWGRYQLVSPGVPVFSIGEPGELFYILLNGTCDVTFAATGTGSAAGGQSSGANGSGSRKTRRRMSLVATKMQNDSSEPVVQLREGHSFGEMAPLFGKPRNATVRASPAVKQSVELLAIDCHRFMKDVLESGQPMLSLSAHDTAHLRLLLLKDPSVRTEYDNSYLTELLAREVPWVADQAAFIRSKIVRELSYTSFGARNMVFRQGDTAREFYIILQGTAGVLGKTKGGEPRVLARLGSRQHFGEMGLTEGRMEGNVRTASVVVESTTLELLKVPKTAYLLAQRFSSRILTLSMEMSQDLRSGLLTPQEKRTDEDIAKTTAAIVKLPLLNRLGFDLRLKLAQFAHARTFKKGEVIWNPGEEATHFYYILTGSVLEFAQRKLKITTQADEVAAKHDSQDEDTSGASQHGPGVGLGGAELMFSASNSASTGAVLLIGHSTRKEDFLAKRSTFVHAFAETECMVIDKALYDQTLRKHQRDEGLRRAGWLERTILRSLGLQRLRKLSAFMEEEDLREGTFVEVTDRIVFVTKGCLRIHAHAHKNGKSDAGKLGKMVLSLYVGECWGVSGTILGEDISCTAVVDRGGAELLSVSSRALVGACFGLSDSDSSKRVSFAEVCKSIAISAEMAELMRSTPSQRKQQETDITKASWWQTRRLTSRLGKNVEPILLAAVERHSYCLKRLADAQSAEATVEDVRNGMTLSNKVRQSKDKNLTDAQVHGSARVGVGHLNITVGTRPGGNAALDVVDDNGNDRNDESALGSASNRPLLVEAKSWARHAPAEELAATLRRAMGSHFKPMEALKNKKPRAASAKSEPRYIDLPDQDDPAYQTIMAYQRRVRMAENAPGRAGLPVAGFLEASPSETNVNLMLPSSQSVPSLHLPASRPGSPMLHHTPGHFVTDFCKSPQSPTRPMSPGGLSLAASPSMASLHSWSSAATIGGDGRMRRSRAPAKTAQALYGATRTTETAKRSTQGERDQVGIHAREIRYAQELNTRTLLQKQNEVWRKSKFRDLDTSLADEYALSRKLRLTDGLLFSDAYLYSNAARLRTRPTTAPRPVVSKPSKRRTKLV